MLNSILTEPAPKNGNCKITTLPVAGERLLVSTIEGWYWLPVQSIVCCCSYNSSTEIKLNNQYSVVTGENISHFEEVLQPFGFMRIHQSALINLTYLRGISKGDGTNTACLATGDKLTISRAKKAELIRMLKEKSVGNVFRKELEIPNSL